MKRLFLYLQPEQKAYYRDWDMQWPMVLTEHVKVGLIMNYTDLYSIGVF